MSLQGTGQGRVTCVCVYLLLKQKVIRIMRNTPFIREVKKIISEQAFMDMHSLNWFGNDVQDLDLQKKEKAFQSKGIVSTREQIHMENGDSFKITGNRQGDYMSWFTQSNLALGLFPNIIIIETFSHLNVPFGKLYDHPKYRVQRGSRRRLSQKDKAEQYLQVLVPKNIGSCINTGTSLKV